MFSSNITIVSPRLGSLLVLFTLLLHSTSEVNGAATLTTSLSRRDEATERQRYHQSQGKAYHQSQEVKSYHQAHEKYNSQGKHVRVESSQRYHSKAQRSYKKSSQVNKSHQKDIGGHKGYRNHNRPYGKRDDQKRSDQYSSGRSLGLEPSTAKINGVYVGFIIEGDSQSMGHIKDLLGRSPATYGKYAQLPGHGQPFDGKQFFWIMQDIKNSGAVFQPAVMPNEGWQGLKTNDNSQAVSIAKVLRKITDFGITVWFRFAHEANWYQRDGTYRGTANDFKEGFHVVAQAVRKYAPSVLIWWTPNVSSMQEYAKYEPWDMSLVDLVGIDYYPKKKSEATTEHFVQLMKPFHDKYAINGRKFALAEAGLHYAGSNADRLHWLTEMANARDQLPNFVAMTWYNCEKEWNYKLVGNGLDNNSLKQKFQ